MEGPRAEFSRRKLPRMAIVAVAFVYTMLILQMVVFIDAVVEILLADAASGLWFDAALTVSQAILAAALLVLGARLAGRQGFGRPGDLWFGASLLCAAQWVVAVFEAVTGFYAPLFLAAAITAGAVLAWLIERRSA